MKTLNVVLAVLVAVGTVSVSVAEPDIAFRPAEVRGVVLFPDGETPVDRLPVRVWDADKEEIVYRTRTDNDGVFGLPEEYVERGNHYVTVGPVRIDVSVMTARAGFQPQPHGFVVVIPKAAPVLPTLVPGSLTTAAAALVPEEEEIIPPPPVVTSP